MEIVYKKDGNQNHMLIKDVKIDENDYKLQMVVHNQIAGILPVKIKQINNVSELWYDTTAKVPMTSLYAAKGMSGQDIYALILSIQHLAEEMKAYLLDVEHIMFDMEYIFVSRREHTYGYCYCPETTGTLHENLRHLFENLLEYMNHRDRQAVLIAYGVQQLTIQSDFTIQELVDCANEHVKEPAHREISQASKPWMASATDMQERRQAETMVDSAEPSERIDVKEKNTAMGFIQKIFGKVRPKRKYLDEEQLEKSDTQHMRHTNKQVGSVTHTIFGRKGVSQREVDWSEDAGTRQIANWSEVADMRQMENWQDENDTTLLTSDWQEEDATTLLRTEHPRPLPVLRSIHRETDMVRTPGSIYPETDMASVPGDIYPETEFVIAPQYLPCVVGKAKRNCDVQLDNPVISRKHIRLLEEDGRYLVEDLNSTNGTFLNGVRLAPHVPQEMISGDKITLANLDFLVE